MKAYETRVTVTLDGNERDVACRAYVDIFYGGSGPYAELDGEPTIYLCPAGGVGDWWDLSQLALGDGDAQRIEDDLYEVALNDDSDQCQEYPDAAE